MVPQHRHGSGQLLARLGVPTPAAQRLPGDRLGAGRCPGVAALPVQLPCLGGLLGRVGVIGTRVGGLGGVLPQRGGGRLHGCGVGRD